MPNEEQEKVARKREEEYEQRKEIEKKSCTYVG